MIKIFGRSHTSSRVIGRRSGVVLLLLYLAGVFASAHVAGRDHLSVDYDRASNVVAEVQSYIQRQDYSQALVKLEATSALRSGDMDYQFLYCMLKERVDEPMSQAKACFANVVNELSKNSAPPCEANLNCVVADLMAEGDNSLKRKEHFLSLPASDAESEVHHYLLDDFERDRYLHMILP